MDWSYDNWPSGEPYDWSGARRGDSEWDQLDFHVDLGCGRAKKGRIGIDQFDAPEVDIVCNLETLRGQLHSRYPLGQSWEDCLPFEDASIESIISHHCMEHIGDGFLRLMGECYRVLKPGGVLRIISPVFPSLSAVVDPDHRRFFVRETWNYFCGTREGLIWTESFSVPNTSARFELVDYEETPQEDGVAPFDEHREFRAALRKWS